MPGLTICRFENGCCVVCGAERINQKQVCLPAENPAGLGDLVKRGLSMVGITKPLVEAVIGGPCACDDRQAMLNKVGVYLGLPPGSTADGR